MGRPTQHEALVELWTAVAPDTPVPELPADELSAFLALLEAMGALDLERGFHLVDPEDDPYPTVVLAEVSGLAELSVAAGVAGMIPFATPAWEDITFYVDTVADPAGCHRVYVRDEEVPPGLPHGLRFRSIPQAARWLAGLVEDEADWDATTAYDAWEKGPTSGSFVLELILELSLPFLWQAVVDGLWPEGGGESFPEAPVAPEPGWQRAACAGLIHELVEHRRLVYPDDFDDSQLDSERLAFVQHLRALVQAVEGRVPRFVQRQADGEDGLLSASARSWISRFENARAIKTESSVERPPDEFEERMLAALGLAVDALVGQELLEVRDEDRAPLVGELWSAAAEAENPQKMLDRLVRSLVDSSHVEEVYADDHEIRDALLTSFKG